MKASKNNAAKPPAGTRGTARRGQQLALMLAMAFAACLPAAAQAPSSPAAGAVRFEAQFHPGETARYTFTAHFSTTSQANPQAAPPKTLHAVPREYDLKGELVAAFAATPPGQPLVGSAHFESLRVEHWQSSADVSGLEALLNELMQSPLMVTTASDGSFDLTGAPKIAPGNPFASDLATLEDAARSVLARRISSAPLRPGQTKGNSAYPIRGVIMPGLEYMSTDRYVSDASIAGHPAAELRLSLRFPRQVMSAKMSSEQGVNDPYLRFQYDLEGSNSLIYLFDPAARQVMDLGFFEHRRHSVVARNTDTGAAVRIPVTVLRVDHNARIMLRRASATASPQRQADLESFEKSLEVSGGAAPPPPPTAHAAVSGRGESLAAYARRMRAERQADRMAAQEAAAAAAHPAAAVPSTPPGFKKYADPNGRLTVLVPNLTMVLRGRENVVTLVGRTAQGQPSVSILLAQRPIAPGIAPNEAIESVAGSMLGLFPGHKMIQGETRSFQGNAGKVFEFRYSESGGAQHAWMAVLVKGARGSAVTCSAPEADSAQASTPCLTVVESLRVP